MNTKRTLLIGITTIAAWTAGLTAAQNRVDLGTAGDFVVLSKAGISTTGTTEVIGNIGVSPIDSTAITGFSLSVHASETYATSPLVNGVVYASDYATPTPTAMTTAIGDMEIAHADAAGRTSGEAINELGAGDISGLTLASGLYKWGTGLLINSDITLSGPSNAVWIFQIADDFTVANGVSIILSGGAQAANIFWQVTGEVNLGTTSHFEGIILCSTAIHLNTGASINGALYAQTAVTLAANSVTFTELRDETVSNWFGLYYITYFNSNVGMGWIYHTQHGWLYMVVNAEGGGIWIWNPSDESWLWTSEAVHPYFYNATTGEWLYFQVESGQWFSIA
jgi:hypothetical protein